MKRLKSIFAVSFVLIRLLLAFACGWVLSFLLAKSNIQITLTLNILFYMGFPLVLGILLPLLTVRRRNPHLIFLSIGTGLLVIAGIYTYWYPYALQQDAEMDAYCSQNGIHCHFGGNGFDMGLLTLFLLYGSVLVLLGVIITGSIIKRTLKKETIHR